MTRMPKVIHAALMMIVAITCLGMLFGGMRYLFTKEPAPVAQVTVSGNQTFSAQHILKMLELGDVWNDVNPLELLSHFQYATFKQVVVRKIYPDRVYVIVEENQPFVVWKFQDEFHVLDENSKLLAILDKGDPSVLPIIVKGGKTQMPQKKTFQKIQQIIKSLKNDAPEWQNTTIDLSDQTNVKLIYPVVEVSLGLGDYPKKIKQLQQVGVQILKQANRQHAKIDLRDPSKVFLSLGKRLS